MDLNDAIAEAYATARTDVVVLHTLEFRCDAFVDENDQPTALRFVMDADQDHTCTLESTAPLNAGQAVTFLGAMFGLTLPSVEEGAAPKLSITVPNIGTKITQHIDNATMGDRPITVTYRAYLDTDTSAPQAKPLTLELDSCKCGGGMITATATLLNLSNKSFPSVLYDTVKFPGLST
jgi:hypothetical protein